MNDLVNLVCAFIDPGKAKQMLTKPEVVENAGFLDDLKSIDPNFDSSKYSDLLESEA